MTVDLTHLGLLSYAASIALLMYWRGQKSPIGRVIRNTLVALATGVVAYLAFPWYAAIGLGLVTGFAGYATGHLKSLTLADPREWILCAASGAIIAVPIAGACAYYSESVASPVLGVILCASKPLWYALGQRISNSREPWQWTQIGEYGTALTTAIGLTVMFAGATS